MRKAKGKEAGAPALWSAGAWLSPVRGSTQEVVPISLSGKLKASLPHGTTNKCSESCTTLAAQA